MDFLRLARGYPALGEFLRGRSLDFNDERAVRCLTEAILFVEYGLKVSIPEGHLIPTVPNRVAYLDWLHRLTPSASHFLDIGTGPIAIYALLGCRLYADWTFVATELNQESYQKAVKTVRDNELEARISLLKVNDPHSILPADLSPVQVTLCNPPFYASQREREEGRLSKASAHPVTPMTQEEGITEGGEVAFIKRLIEQSCLHSHRDQIHWFTCLVGLKSTLFPIKLHLEQQGVSITKTGRFQTGQTVRWIIAWTFVNPLVRYLQSLGYLQVEPGVFHIDSVRWTRQARRRGQHTPCDPFRLHVEPLPRCEGGGDPALQDSLLEHLRRK